MPAVTAPTIWSCATLLRLSAEDFYAPSPHSCFYNLFHCSAVCAEQASILVRRHDEAETCRRAYAIARREVGCVQRGRCGSGREQEDAAHLDRAARSWSRGHPSSGGGGG